MCRHRDFGAIRQHEFGIFAEFLDETEDVVPAAAILADDVILQFVENLVDLECSQNGLDQHRDLDLAGCDDAGLLRILEDIAPQTRLQVIFEFRQVKVWAGAAFL